MKVLFYLRANHKQVKGGDLVQLYSTAEALKRIGINIDYSSDPNLNLSKYDVIHIFNSPRFSETKEFFENAIRQNKPIAFSTIFWSKEELALGIAKTKKVQLTARIFGISITKKVWKLAKKVQNFIKRDKSQKIEKWLFKNADILLPNSESEIKEIERVYHLRNSKYKIVCNAINEDLFKEEPKVKRKPYILSVGRIELRKNTLKLIEACHNIGKHLVLIGNLDLDDEYGQICQQKISQYGFKHIVNLDQRKLLPYYYEAQVFALASWYETPGLSTMEAACGGCTIVSTDKGSTKEYFGKDAIYCDPFLLNSIEHAISRAFDEPFNLKLRKKIIKNYTWKIAASETLNGYRRCL